MQVLGHSNTVCVLLGGWLFLGDRVSPKQLMGMALAVFGMILYGFSTYVPSFLPLNFALMLASSPAHLSWLLVA